MAATFCFTALPYSSYCSRSSCMWMCVCYVCLEVSEGGSMRQRQRRRQLEEQGCWAARGCNLGQTFRTQKCRVCATTITPLCCFVQYSSPTYLMLLMFPNCLLATTNFLLAVKTAEAYQERRRNRRPWKKNLSFFDRNYLKNYTNVLV